MNMKNVLLINGVPHEVKTESISSFFERYCSYAENNEEETSDNVISNENRTRCTVWTRVMGYHRPTESFNLGKKGEHKERKFFILGV